MRPHSEAILGLTDAVCREHLADEYAQLCRNWPLGSATSAIHPSTATGHGAENSIRK
jgi:hypothetical protein